MTEYVVRFLAGGLIVSAFAILSDILRAQELRRLAGSRRLGRTGDARHRHRPARRSLCRSGELDDDVWRGGAGLLQPSASF
jgi:hypothetical protein